MIIRAEEAEKKAILDVACLMAAAARTAPKGCGIDNLETLILDGEDKDRLAEEMRRLGREYGDMDFVIRDGYNVDASQAILLIGARNRPILLANCGYCGFKNCGENRKAGAMCSFNVGDLGIAIGSAVAVAADHRIDNRVMFSAGKAALSLKLFPEDVKVIYGIPLSATAKSPYFDRDMAAILEQEAE